MKPSVPETPPFLPAPKGPRKLKQGAPGNARIFWMNLGLVIG